MKKSASLLVMIILGTQLVLAQGSYFRLGLGYGISLGGQVINTNQTYMSSQTGTSGRYEGVYGSFGSGLALNGAFGHMFSKNIGVDIGGQYLLGRKFNGSSTSNFTGSPSTVATSSYYSSGFMITPSLVLTTGASKAKPYARVGVITGIVKVTGEMESTSASGQTKMVTEYRGGISIGFNGGIGMEWELSDQLHFFSELMITSMSYYPDERVVVEHKINGVNQPLENQKITYEDEYTFSSASTGAPQHALSNSMPFGSLSLNAGLKFVLK